ncbi:uncharacterized protein LOC143882087 [Tasmannia lanceolata]|uniref:uncharacterized protein LOC143882087 n=1 Tax=Tasmannia lanceolata TaxID=3420 RepID=UPI004063BF00
MDSQPNCLAYAPPADDSATQKENEGSHALVDPFLKEALQNPRHRVTVLRMELDIQRFMQNPDQHQFEFPHFPTSYLRLAAHRVAQHCGLQSMVLDNTIDGSGSKIIVRKTTETRYPAVCLSDIPAKQPENDKPEKVKIAIRPRQHKTSPGDGTEHSTRRSLVRTVEEREEEYDRARARIFSGSNSPDLESISSQDPVDGGSPGSSRDEIEVYKDGSSRVAIFRDREKDRTDPDYDRSYDRYVRSLTPTQNISLGPFSMLQPPFVQYETSFPQLGQLPRTQNPMNYGASNGLLCPIAVGSNQNYRDAVYHLHWPSPAIMYANSYQHFRHAIFQAPFNQQPLSFDYSQNY